MRAIILSYLTLYPLIFCLSSQALATENDDIVSNDNTAAGISEETIESIKNQCGCNDVDPNDWAVFRMKDGQLLDYSQLLFAKPNTFHARINTETRDEPLDVYVVAFGNNITNESLPTLDSNEIWYSAMLRDIGFIAAAQVEPGETWVFKIGGKYIEKHYPRLETPLQLSWRFEDEAGLKITAGEFEINNQYSFKKQCTGKDGSIIASSILYRGSAIAFEELNPEWFLIDWLPIGLPEELGEFYILRDSVISSGTVTIDDFEYYFEVPHVSPE